MQPDQYPLMRAHEERHWWYRGNRAVVRRLLLRWAPAAAALRLDAGCGTGKNLEAFAEFGPAVGIDFSAAALASCRERGLHLLARASVTALPFPDRSFALVTCFEVLTHAAVGDWRAALVEFHRVLQPGGLVVLREPAFAALRGSHDEVVHSVHRFRRRELRDAVEGAGFEVLRCSYQNLLLFFPALLVRSWQRWRGTMQQQPVADFDKGNLALGSLCTAWLTCEGVWLQFLRLPLGSSVLCVARKRSGAGLER
ncbi:MAG: class I SAM-dependent methyltransferase [Planctomycetes bacterium]|nr:class I SAM-dependent methyltransferase [Planctomycetota bacterium]